MATKYLAEGATSFASPNWSGGAIADTDDLVIEKPFGQIAAGLSQTSINLESLRINPGATAGRVGGGSNGSFLVDVDNSSDAYVSNMGNVELFIQAAGGNTLINNLDQAGPGGTFITGGTVANITVEAGRLTANGSTVITNFVAVGGSGEIAYNATAITSARISGGVWTIRRAVTTLTISGNATVFYDPDDAASMSGTTIVTRGGRLVHIAGSTPTITNEGGTHDFSQARRTLTLGATAWTAIGTRFVPSTNVATTNRTRLYGSQVAPDFIPFP